MTRDRGEGTAFFCLDHRDGFPGGFGHGFGIQGGGALWIGSVTIAGYLFGNVPWVKEHLEWIIWGAILIPGLLVLIGAWRARMKQAKAA